MITDLNLLQDQSKPYDSKKDCWVPDAEDGYIQAQIQSVTGDSVKVITKNQNEVRGGSIRHSKEFDHDLQYSARFHHNFPTVENFRQELEND